MLPGSGWVVINVVDQQGGTLEFKAKGSTRMSSLYSAYGDRQGLSGGNYCLLHDANNVRLDWTVDENEILDGDRVDVVLQQVGD